MIKCLFENEKIRQVEENGVEYIQFKKLLAYSELKHAYILKTNDMDFRLGKDFSNREKVSKNLEKVAETIGFDYLYIVRPDYAHTNQVEVIEKLDKSEMPSLSGKNFKSTDGLITNQKNMVLMSTNADCNLLFMYDPKQKIIANVHAGWRGTFHKIVQKAIEKMKSEYLCQPEDIICCFCPSIRKCHFEVEEDVANECKEIFEDTGRLEEIISIGAIKEGKQKYNIDTILINKILLQQEGIHIDNIIDSEICSVCHADKVHSRRAEGLHFGLGCALIERK